MWHIPNEIDKKRKYSSRVQWVFITLPFNVYFKGNIRVFKDTPQVILFSSKTMLSEPPSQFCYEPKTAL